MWVGGAASARMRVRAAHPSVGRSPHRRHHRKTEKEEDDELIQHDTEEETVYSFQATPSCASRVAVC